MYHSAFVLSSIIFLSSSSFFGTFTISGTVTAFNFRKAYV